MKGEPWEKKGPKRKRRRKKRKGGRKHAGKMKKPREENNGKELSGRNQKLAKFKSKEIGKIEIRRYCVKHCGFGAAAWMNFDTPGAQF